MNLESTCNIDVKSQLAVQLKQTVLITWDEIIGTHCLNLEAVDRTLCNLFQSVLPFEGILIHRIGDFRQILPVLRTANRSEIISACFKKSLLYSWIKILHLNSNKQLIALHSDPFTSPNVCSTAPTCYVSVKESCNRKRKIILYFPHQLSRFSKYIQQYRTILQISNITIKTSHGFLKELHLQHGTSDK